jgi:hypothetical protein
MSFLVEYEKQWFLVYTEKEVSNWRAISTAAHNYPADFEVKQWKNLNKSQKDAVVKAAEGLKKRRQLVEKLKEDLRGN